MAYALRQLKVHEKNYPIHDCDFQLMYHPRKANVVAYALSRKIIHLSSLMVKELELIERFRDMDIYVERKEDNISF
ncbi:hypothetical protein CR513_58290, partial [Mucuna pruriens]